MIALRGRGLAAAVPAPSGETRWLFRGLDLEVGSGEVLVVIGPNGAGKTTLLRALVGLRELDGGQVDVDGAPIGELAAAHRARRIAYLPPATALYHDLPVLDLVMLGRSPHMGRLRPPSPVDHRRVAEALAQVGASSLAARSVATLSSGERQRVYLARMLATEAPILVLDEPTTALDIGHALGFLELCRTLARDGAAVVLAMHELELARRYGDRAICLTDTEAHTSGPVDQVICPDVLAPAFGVEVELTDAGLVCRPRAVL